MKPWQENPQATLTRGVTPTYNHASDEVVIVTEGPGAIEIGGQTFRVAFGDSVRTSSNARHHTAADPTAVDWAINPGLLSPGRRKSPCVPEVASDRVAP